MTHQEYKPRRDPKNEREKIQDAENITLPMLTYSFALLDGSFEEAVGEEKMLAFKSQFIEWAVKQDFWRDFMGRVGQISNLKVNHDRFKDQCFGFVVTALNILPSAATDAFMAALVTRQGDFVSGILDLVDKEAGTGPRQQKSFRATAESWDIDRVVEWVCDIGLGAFAELFRSHEIEGTEIMHITAEDLKYMGIRDEAARKTFLLEKVRVVEEVEASRELTLDFERIEMWSLTPVQPGIPLSTWGGGVIAGVADGCKITTLALVLRLLGKMPGLVSETLITYLSYHPEVTGAGRRGFSKENGVDRDITEEVLQVLEDPNLSEGIDFIRIREQLTEPPGEKQASLWEKLAALPSASFCVPASLPS